MKLTTKQLQRIIREELTNLSEKTYVGGGHIDTEEGELPDHIDIVNDLVDAMSAAGKEWLAMATKGQTPEAAAKYEQAYDILEDALITGAQSKGEYKWDDSETTKRIPGAYDAMRESKSIKSRPKNKKRLKIRRK